MPALPWTGFIEADPDREYLVMASRLPLAGFAKMPSFMSATSAIRKQLARTEGLVGYTLDAHIARKQFFTLSAWESEDALARFSAAEPHHDRVERIRPHMNPTTFVTWTVRGSELPISWDDAHARIEAARVH